LEWSAAVTDAVKTAVVTVLSAHVNI